LGALFAEAHRPTPTRPSLQREMRGCLASHWLQRRERRRPDVISHGASTRHPLRASPVGIFRLRHVRSGLPSTYRWYHKGRKHHKTGQRHHRPEPWNGHGKPWNPWKPPMLHAWWYSAYRTVARCSRYSTSTVLDTYSKLQYIPTSTGPETRRSRHGFRNERYQPQYVTNLSSHGPTQAAESSFLISRQLAQGRMSYILYSP
jgi:hypothetical protein